MISFCSANKNAIAADSLNAAHFINCSDPNPNISHYIQECPYPELFSTETYSCQDFRTVPVDSRIVPQAPCEFKSWLEPSCRVRENIYWEGVKTPNWRNE